jgi:hypothetical protein
MTLRLPGEDDGQFLDRIDAGWWMREKQNNREDTMSIPAGEVTPEQHVINMLKAQVKEIEDKKAADHRRNQLLEEAEAIRKQLRSYGITPVA